MIKFEYPEKLHPSFVNITTNQHDVIVWEGGRGGAKSEAWLVSLLPSLLLMMALFCVAVKFRSLLMTHYMQQSSAQYQSTK